jgi:hypothetical protein
VQRYLAQEKLAVLEYQKSRMALLPFHENSWFFYSKRLNKSMLRCHAKSAAGLL